MVKADVLKIRMVEEVILKMRLRITATQLQVLSDPGPQQGYFQTSLVMSWMKKGIEKYRLNGPMVRYSC